MEDVLVGNWSFSKSLCNHEIESMLIQPQASFLAKRSLEDITSSSERPLLNSWVQTGLRGSLFPDRREPRRSACW